MFKSYCSEPVELATTGDTDELCYSHLNLRCWVWCWWNRWRFDDVLRNFIVCDDFFANKQQIMEIAAGSRFTYEVWGAVWTCNLFATQRFLTKVWRRVDRHTFGARRSCSRRTSCSDRPWCDAVSSKEKRDRRCSGERRDLESGDEIGRPWTTHFARWYKETMTDGEEFLWRLLMVERSRKAQEGRGRLPAVARDQT
jgi:hypothetical protein